jgi:hypothetical protein
LRRSIANPPALVASSFERSRRRAKRHVPLVAGWQHLAIGTAMQLKFENNQRMKSTEACSVGFLSDNAT